MALHTCCSHIEKQACSHAQQFKKTIEWRMKEQLWDWAPVTWTAGSQVPQNEQSLKHTEGQQEKMRVGWRGGRALHRKIIYLQGSEVMQGHTQGFHWNTSLRKKIYIKIIFCVSIGMACHGCHGACMDGDWKTTCGVQFSPSTMWGLGTKLRSSGLVASTFTMQPYHSSG